MSFRKAWIFLVAFSVLTVGNACAQESQSTEALAKAAQNPIAAMISVPFQNNFNFGMGAKDNTGYTLNFQPVIPVKLTDDWNLITRWIMPITYLPEMYDGAKEYFGFGDFNPSFYFSPAASGKLIWGVGPVMTFPTASKPQLGSQKYSAGPGIVALTMQGKWVYGGLINNQWSYAGNDKRRDVNFMLVQPFVNYNLPKGWYLTSSPMITADWEANNDNTWTVPLGGGVGRIIRIGKLPANVQLAGYYNVEKPDGAADWQLRFQVQFLFPAGKK